jgi:hypothetical protein
MKRLIVIVFAILCVWSGLQAQTDTIRYFQSYFETLVDQQQWTNVPSDNNKNWIFNSKGGYVYEGDNYNPEYAFEGTYNAFHAWSNWEPDNRKIVSIPFDLSDAKKPQLSFAYAMYNHPTPNELYVLFKAGPTAPWDTIYHYDSPMDQWDVESFNISDYGAKYLCKGFQLAFLSKAKGEFGVCVDSVVIVEKDVIIRHVKSVKINQVIQNPLPSGSVDIPVMRVDVNVLGNTDPLALGSIVFQSLSSSDDLFETNGFELVATKDSVYRNMSKGTSLKIGSPVSISGGQISFNSLNYNLSTGYNAIWLIADVKSTAPHQSMADFKVGAGAIHINGSTYPATEASPAGQNTIEQSVFYDNFDGASLWTIASDFEIATPKGLEAYITKDPDFAYSGTRILGTDLTVDGQYKYGVNAPPNNYPSYYATTPSIDLQYYNDVKLSFKKWFGFEGTDQGVIEVSLDNGITWTRIWNSKVDALSSDIGWNDYLLAQPFNALVAHQPNVKIRFGITLSDVNFAYCGFNIDNFAVTGNYLTNDVGIVNVIKPVSDCHNPGMDTIKIVVHNYADRATAASVPVFFSIDGSDAKKVVENIPGPIPSGGTVTYVFTHAAEFPGPGNYNNFTVKLQVPGDEDATNNTVVKGIFIQKSNSIPDSEPFETGGGYWKRYGSDTRWQCMVPEGSIPNISQNSWISSPFGNYFTSDTSYLESSCYDLATAGRLIYEMQLWIDSEPEHDGALVEYSTDNGATWSVLPAHEFTWDWNWYNGNVVALGGDGWSGINTSDWKLVKQVLPATLSGEPKVKFRMKWASDENNAYRGMAIDNVKIYEAPLDIGVSKIDSFANRCQGLNPDEVTVTIKNLGINRLKQNDTIIVGFDFNQAHMETDTFRLSSDLLPGQTIKHTFNTSVNVSAPGSYSLRAYTLIEDNPWFYEGNNDTSQVNFQVYPGPITSLIDTIQTHLPDTVVLTTYYHTNYDYWWNGINGSNTYDVQIGGWQYLKVTATRGNGCSSYDSTNVELLFYDLGASELMHPVDDCGFGKHEYPVVRVLNYGTDSIVAGQEIAVSYRMNSGPEVSDILKLTNTLYSGKTVDFTFTKGALDLSQKGTYVFDLKTTYAGDTVASNDGISRSAEILGRPAVSLGPDLTVQALSHTLNAGSGFESYLWDNATTLQTREINESGSYWVQVYDENLCDNSDTVYVWLKIRDISPDGFASPLSDCSFNPAEPVSLRIVNSGTDTIPVGTGISVSYRFQGGTRVSGSFNLTTQLVPGAAVMHNFAELLNLNLPGDYLFEATAATASDLKKYNDTSEVTVYRYARPVVDFGLPSAVTIEDISYEIDADFDPNYTYLWQDGFTEHLYTATKSGLCHVIATDNRTSCYDRDSVMVFLAYPDVGVTWTDMPVNGCTGEFEDVIVRVQSLGTSNIGSTTPINVACDVNGVRVITETLVRNTNLSPGASLELTLSGKITITQSGSSEVRFYTLMPLDKRNENDILVATFDALPAPVIDFGDVNGVLNTELPHVLDAGAGQKAYLWQDASTGQTFNVLQKGVYSVTVTGQNDCQTKKTVSVNMSDGIDETAGKSKIITIFPNPSNGLFHISIETEKPGDLDVRIFDGQGKIVFIRQINSEELEREQIDIQHLPRGLYHILIQHGTELHQGKVVIQ